MSGAADIGVLPAQALRRLIAAGAVAAADGVPEALIQPASLDLRLGDKAFRVRASFLAGRGFTIERRLERFAMHEV
ncbi:MAG: 2'-deoxycytidine 5'-triphosphate deaminase, partial [Pseudomonadota bacterium]